MTPSSDRPRPATKPAMRTTPPRATSPAARGVSSTSGSAATPRSVCATPGVRPVALHPRLPSSRPAVRVCLVYDCLFPWTVGGAERWMRNVAEALAADGHRVTYLTRRQWDAGDAPDIPGVDVVAVSEGGDLYGPDGNRTVGPPLRFGLGVARHLARHGRDYDVVHTASFPYFSLLAAGAFRRRGRYRIVADWHEVWSDAYWA